MSGPMLKSKALLRPSDRLGDCVTWQRSVALMVGEQESVCNLADDLDSQIAQRDLMLMLVLGAGTGDEPQLPRAINLVAVHARHFAHSLTRDKAKLDDLLHRLRARYSFRQHIPE